MDRVHAEPETGCCPRFDPEPWDEKEVTWRDRLFLKDRVRSFLHVPLNFGKVMVRNMEKIAASGAVTPEPLMLCDENSLWGADVYIAVAKDVAGAQMAKVSGAFLTKVFEGPYKDAGKWRKEMRSFVASRGLEAKKVYSFYTTCPRCAKFYGKNYTVLVAEV